jgi:hypothetical protein
MDGGIMSKREETIIEDAKLRYKESVTGWQDIYKTATDDLKFVYDVEDGQWPETIRNEREKDGRPIITVNKLQKFVRQLRGDQMMNRPRIKVIPVDSKQTLIWRNSTMGLSDRSSIFRLRK